MRSVLTALCLFASTAHAVPAQFTHQGRLLDADGVPLADEATITFRVINAETGGTTLWEEAITVSLTNGFYAVVLGADETNPLDTTTFAEAPVWLELQLEGEGAMFPRSAINAVPYASMATVAEELSGGPVDASDISVGGTPVVNESGEWVGPAPTVSWDDLTDVPADFADGVDDDTTPESDSFADLGVTCIDGDIPVWDGTTEAWSCTFDQDSLADMDCTEGQIIRWNDESVGWICSDDIDSVLSEDEVNAIVSGVGYAMASEVFSGSFLDLADLPDGLLDGDDNTQLTAAEVDAIVADNGYAMTEDLFSGLFNELTGIPDGLLDGDDNTQLSEADVDAFVENNGYASTTDIFSGIFSDLTGIPDGLLDGDDNTQLTPDEVDAIVADNGYSIAAEVDPQISALLAEIETLKDQYAELEATVEEATTSAVGPVMYGNYSIDNSVALANLEGFTEVTGNLSINAGDVPNLDALSALTRVGANLIISGNSTITDLSGLANLASVGQDLQIYNNGSLTSLEGLQQLTTIPAELDVSNNSVLVSLAGLDGLTTVGQSFSIANNDTLTTLSGLDHLVSIGANFQVVYNDALEDLDGVEQLYSIGATFNMYGNDVLASIAGLSGVTSIGESINIYNHATLCDSLIDAFWSRMRSLGWDNDFYINNNNTC